MKIFTRKYSSTVIIGLCIHGFLVLPALFTLATRSLPFKFLANMTSAFTTAFGTGSSSATLPVTIGLLETKNGVDPRVCRWVLIHCPCDRNLLTSDYPFIP